MWAVLILLFATYAHAQSSQFLFDAKGNLTVQLAETILPPQIIGQPQNQIVATNDLAAFSVIVANPRSMTYQWRFNNANLGGATNDSLLLENVNATNEGDYRVVLTNPSGSVTSAPAMLWIDNDFDGVADSWELAFFTNLNQTATADFDGDGVSNLQEFLDGTNPTNSISARYRILLFVDGGTVTKTPDQSSYTNGESVTLTAIAATNAPFRTWLGDIVTRTNPVTLVMTNNKTVAALFTPVVFNWTNFAGGDWNNATNWTPNLAPGSNDTVVISASLAAPGNFTITLDTPADCASVTLASSALGTPTLTGSGTLTVRESLLWRGGTMSGSGRTVLESGATLTLETVNAVNLNTRTLELGGETFWEAAGNLFLNNAVITNRVGAVFHAINAGTINGVSGACRFDNAGTFHRAGGGATTINSVGFNNYGAVAIEAGTNRLAGGGSSTGAFTAFAGAVVEWTGGTFTLNPGAQLNGSGLYKLNGGNVTADANLTVTNLELVSGSSTLGGTGTVTVASLMNWTAGVMSGTGRTIISPGTTLNAAIPSQVNLVNRTLENGGTVIWTNGTIALNASLITNRPGALFHALGPGNLGILGGSPRIDNAGTFRKSVNTGITTIGGGGLGFNNSGTVDIQTGTLLCSGGFTNSGTVNLLAGTTNHLAGGGSATGTFSASSGAGVEWTGGTTFTLNPGAQLNGAGLYKLNGGNVTADANLTVTNLELVSGSSTLGGVGTVTIASLMNWTAGVMSGTGRTIIASGATLNAAIPSQVNLVNRTLENGGTVIWTNGTIALNASLITNRPGALFHVQGAGLLGILGGSPRFDNAGTFRKSAGTGTTTVAGGVPFNNFGTVEIQTGTLLCNGSFNNSGAVNLSAGATNRLVGGGSATGLFTAPAGAGLEWTGGTFTLNPGAQINGSGLYKINGGTLTANANVVVENLDLIAGTLDGTSAVTVNTAMNWTAASMSGTGRTIIAPGATLNAGILSQANVVTRTLENGGTVLWTNNGTIALNGGIITNRPGSLFHAQGAGLLGILGGSPRFDNAGTFRKSVSTGTTTIASGVPFNNSGTVDLRSGILVANGGYASSSNALLNCALGGTIAGTNYGQLQVAGTVTLNGGLSVDLLPGFSPATNDAFTVVTAGTRNSAFANFFYPSNRVTLSLSNSPTSVVLRATGVFPVPQPVLLTPQLVGSNALLTWTATSNITYRLENNADVGSTNWTSIPGDVTTFSNTASKFDALTPSNRFYRVRVLP